MKIGISGKLLMFSAMVFGGFTLLAGFASQQIHQNLVAERIEKIRSLSETATSTVKSAYTRFQSGELTEEAAKSFVKNHLRASRFGKGDYFFIFTYEGEQVVHGLSPEREGKNFYKATDSNGKYFVKELIDHGLDGTNITS